jgi:hypothetical protein
MALRSFLRGATTGSFVEGLGFRATRHMMACNYATEATIDGIPVEVFVATFNADPCVCMRTSMPACGEKLARLVNTVKLQ